MPPETGTALIILVAFVLPGFITVLIKERTHETPQDVTQLDRLLRALYYSVWSYTLLAAVAFVLDLHRSDVQTLWDRRATDPAPLVLVVAAAIIIPSALLATCSGLWEGSAAQTWVRTKLRINLRHRTPTAWDHFFSLRSRAMVRATMKDGRVVGGFYGPKSFAAYAKDGRDLYLEQRWAMDEDLDWFQEPAKATQGVWLPTDEVVSIELYTEEDG